MLVVDLVGDIEDSIREKLIRRFQRWGHEVAAVGSPQDALRQMAAMPAEIVVIDLIMPAHSGLRLLEQLRERWPETVTVVLGNAEELETIAKALKHGAVDYIPKPIERDVLYQALRHALTTSASRRERTP